MQRCRHFAHQQTNAMALSDSHRQIKVGDDFLHKSIQHCLIRIPVKPYTPVHRAQRPYTHQDGWSCLLLCPARGPPSSSSSSTESRAGEKASPTTATLHKSSEGWSWPARRRTWRRAALTLRGSTATSKRVNKKTKELQWMLKKKDKRRKANS